MHYPILGGCNIRGKGLVLNPKPEKKLTHESVISQLLSLRVKQCLGNPWPSSPETFRTLEIHERPHAIP